MITRTTKQIHSEIANNKSLWFHYDDTPEERKIKQDNLDKVWVGLDKLKKRKIVPVMDLKGKLKYYSLELSINDYNDLCNSQEQKDELEELSDDAKKDVDAVMLKQSSPVHSLTPKRSEVSVHETNPKDKFIKENFTNVNGCLIQISKKCTCGLNYVSNTNPNVCGRCGGEL